MRHQSDRNGPATSFTINARRRFVSASLLVALVFGPAFGAADGASGVVELQRPTAVPGEDDRDPFVFSRNVVSLAERAVALGHEVGISPEALEQILEHRREFEHASTYELSEAAEQLGPYVGRINRALSRLVIMPAPRDDQRSAAMSPDGPWLSDPTSVAAAAYPTDLSIAVSETVVQEGATNTNVMVCASNPVLGCFENADCPAGDCIDRPTGVSEIHEIVVESGCSSRPTMTKLKQLTELTTEIESAQVLLNRFCNQVILGFNASLACISGDLILVEQRTLLDFTLNCADRWSDAEVRSSYSRLAFLRDEDQLIKAKQDEIQQSAGQNHDTTMQQITDVQSQLSDKLDTAIAEVDSSGDAVDAQIIGARDSINANIDGTRNQLAGSLGDARTSINANIDGTRSQLSGDIGGARDSINANVDSTRGLLASEIGTTRDLLGTNIDDTRDELAGAIDDTRELLTTNVDDTRATLLAELKAQEDLFFRAEIERVLLYGERLTVYYLPEAQGGQLERIRQVVEDAIDGVEASGEPSYQARSKLNAAVTEMNAGRYKRAFNFFSLAYFEAMKLPGERQP